VILELMIDELRAHRELDRQVFQGLAAPTGSHTFFESGRTRFARSIPEPVSANGGHGKMREMNDDPRHETRGDPVDQLTTMTCERDGRVARATLDRPERGNALRRSRSKTCKG
jgi:hypothetical protein